MTTPEPIVPRLGAKVRYRALGDTVIKTGEITDMQPDGSVCLDGQHWLSSERLDVISFLPEPQEDCLSLRQAS